MKQSTSIICAIAFVFTSQLPGYSQSYPVRQIWDTNRLIEVDIEKQEIRTLGPRKEDQKTIRLPIETRWAGWAQGSFWALQKPVPLAEEGGENENPRMVQFVWMYDSISKEWVKEALWDASKAGVAKAIFPIEGDRFILLPSMYFDYEPSHDQQMILIGRKSTRRDKFIDILKIPDLGLGGPSYWGIKKTEAEIKNSSTPESWKLKINPKSLIYRNLKTEIPLPMVELGNHTVLFSQYLGVFWVFDHHGDVSKKVNLIPEIEDKDYANIFSFERAILGWQPTPNGTIMFASRSPKTILHARKAYPILDVNGHLHGGEASEVFDRRVTEEFPEIEWMEFDPEMGAFKHISTPDNCPDKMTQLVKAYGVFSFHMNPEGVPIFDSPLKKQVSPKSSSPGMGDTAVPTPLKAPKPLPSSK